CLEVAAAPFQGGAFLARRDVPELAAPVVRGTGQRLAVAGKGKRVDGPVVPREGGPLRPRRRVPQLDRVVAAAAGEQLAVGGDGGQHARGGAGEYAGARVEDGGRPGHSSRNGTRAPAAPRAFPGRGRPSRMR